MGGKATRLQRARLEARQRRLELDQDRDARDARIETAVAEVLILADHHQHLRHQITQAKIGVSTGLRQLIEQENLTLTQAATLCGLPLPQARRMLRAARAAVTATTAHESPARSHGGPDAGPDTDAPGWLEEPVVVSRMA